MLDLESEILSSGPLARMPVNELGEEGGCKATIAATVDIDGVAAAVVRLVAAAVVVSLLWLNGMVAGYISARLANATYSPLD